MKTPELSHKQMEAIADILVLAMYADGHVSVLEDETLHEKVDGLGWGENQSPSHYLNLSTARVRDADSPEKAMEMLNARAAVLADYDSKEFVFQKTMELLKSDGLAEEESYFVHQLRKALGV